MSIRSQWKPVFWTLAVFLGVYFMPLGHARFDNAVMEALFLARSYAREHVLLCLLPAFFIAGAIGVFVSQGAVMKYLGSGAKKVLSYAVASVSGSVLAVCSCTVLPLFAGIYRMGAGIGPATAFLYSGPAINVLAIILTARVLGIELGLARALGAVVFSVVIGLLMHLFFRKDEAARQAAAPAQFTGEGGRALWKNGVFFLLMVLIMITATWGGCGECTGGFQNAIFGIKGLLLTLFGALLGAVLTLWMGIRFWKLLAVGAAVFISSMLTQGILVPFVTGMAGLTLILSRDRGEGREWLDSTFGFARQILPLLLAGVLVAGFLLGRVRGEGIVPSSWIEWAVGGNSIRANLFASVAGALMYFATLTEIPILQGLIDSGMGQGPALSLLLAGPALSLPNMLVIRSVMGTKKTLVFVFLVVVMATLSGLLFGALV